jgi:hypothetical protein
MLTQSRHPPLLISTLIPSPYSSASHCRYRASKLLRGPSSNEVTSFGDKDTVPDDDAELPDGRKDASRESWKHVLAWKVCSRARVVNTCRSRRSASPARASGGTIDGGEACREFTFTPVDFPLDEDIPLECCLVGAKLGPASGLPSIPIPRLRTYGMPTDRSSSPSSLTLPQLAPFPVEYDIDEFPRHEPIQRPAQIIQTSSYIRHPSIQAEGSLVLSSETSQHVP